METYATLHTGVKVSERVFCSEQILEGESPLKYVIKDLEGKLLGHLVFKDKEQDGITEIDLLVILIDRLQSKQEGLKKTRESGFALARIEESKMWLEKK